MGGEGGAEPVIHFVFVHGASHGAWCWYKLTTLLDAAGFKSTSVDLTGAGISLIDSNIVFDSDQYNRPLFSLLSDLPPHHKVILVGHSIGGGSVTEALCKFTDKISMAIYLAASMVQPGSIPSPHLSNVSVTLLLTHLSSSSFFFVMYRRYIEPLASYLTLVSI